MQTIQRRNTGRILHWIARVAGTAAIVPLMLIFFGEPGHGPVGVRERIYLVLFPWAFSVGYLIGWRWPLFGGLVSLGSMIASQIVIGRTFPLAPYVIWGILSLPGLVYVLAGYLLGGSSPPRSGIFQNQSPPAVNGSDMCSPSLR